MSMRSLIETYTFTAAEIIIYFMFLPLSLFSGHTNLLPYDLNYRINMHALI